MTKTQSPTILPEPKNDNIKNNEFHTLFIKKVPAETVQVFPEHNKYTIYLTEFGEYSRGLHEAYNSLREATENDVLEIRISSNGGYISEGKILYNLVNEKFNGRCITVLDPMGYSMGALAFCFGDTRIIYENSEIMFHNYSSIFLGKGNEILANVKHTDKSIKNFFDSVVIGLSESEKESLYAGGDYWFDAKEMCKRKIATDVSIGNYIFTSSEYLELLKRMTKKAKKMGIKKQIKSLQEAKKVYNIDVIPEFLKELEEKEKTLSTNSKKEKNEI